MPEVHCTTVYRTSTVSTSLVAPLKRAEVKEHAVDMIRQGIGGKTTGDGVILRETTVGMVLAARSVEGGRKLTTGKVKYRV